MYSNLQHHPCFSVYMQTRVLLSQRRGTLRILGQRCAGKTDLKSLTETKLYCNVATLFQISQQKPSPPPPPSQTKHMQKQKTPHCFNLSFSLSLETIKASVKQMDIDYFLGHCCFVVVQGMFPSPCYEIPQLLLLREESLSPGTGKPRAFAQQHLQIPLNPPKKNNYFSIRS